jgi:hypothetical protein
LFLLRRRRRLLLLRLLLLLLRRRRRRRRLSILVLFLTGLALIHGRLAHHFSARRRHFALGGGLPCACVIEHLAIAAVVIRSGSGVRVIGPTEDIRVNALHARQCV